jgi:GTP-binding protein
MRFIDEAKIFVKGGDGGNGCASFRREAHEPRGGPDGGDGGHGGSIIFVVDPQLSTLSDFRYRREFKAPRGEHGRGKDQYGRSGEDFIVRVPVGTLVKDEEGELLADLSIADEKFVVAKGGRGGRGNIRFKSSTNRAPRRADPGEAGEERWIQLELKLLADVGLIGKPNAGKSTLLSKISNARPKIADYPFTTLHPILGVVEPFHGRKGVRHESLADTPTFTVADIPGLIEGAHKGAGLGDQFLRHIERTKIFLHLIDVSDLVEDPLHSYEEIRKELKAYNLEFLERPEWIVLNKIDLIKDASLLADYRKRFEKKKKKVFPISAVTGEGIRELITKLAEVVKKA